MTTHADERQALSDTLYHWSAQSVAAVHDRRAERRRFLFSSAVVDRCYRKAS